VAQRSGLSTASFTTVAAAAVWRASASPLGGLVFKATNSGAGTAVKAYGQSGTSVQFRGAALWDVDSTYVYGFVGLQEIGSGKFVSLGLYKNGAGARLSASSWNSLTSYNAEIAGLTVPTNTWARLMAGEPLRLRVWNTGGSRSYEYAWGDDGWSVLATSGTTSWCTPDRRLVGADPSTGTSGTTGWWIYEFGDAS
jgi:hypothetical protein